METLESELTSLKNKQQITSVTVAQVHTKKKQG
jgi:hypothetical protein